MRGPIALVAATAVAVLPFSAAAQCKADVDCKGNRICEAGACVDPNPRQPHAPPPGGVTVTYADEPIDEPIGSSGWAMPAAIVGFAGAALALGLAVASEVTKDDLVPSLPLGIAATVFAAVIGPVTFAGGRSARIEGGATGVGALRVMGWIFYGVSLASALLLIVFGATERTPIPGHIALTGVVGAASLTCFAIDAIVGHSQTVADTGGGIGPSLGFARDLDGTARPTIGLGVRL